MPAPTTLPGHLRVARRDSLRWRLPLMMSVLIAGVLGSFLWAAAYHVQQAMLASAGSRLAGAGARVGEFLGQSQSLAATERAANHDAIRAYLANPTPEAEAAVRGVLGSIARSSTGQRADLFDARGAHVLAIASPPPSTGTFAGITLPQPPAPTAPGVLPMREVAGRPFVQLVGEVAGDGQRAGLLVLSATLSVNPPGILGRLVGDDAQVTVGNRGDDVWTDFTGPANPPPVDRSRTGRFEYSTPEGEARIGALVDVPSTPWAIWVEMPREVLVRPARQFLAVMGPIALLLLVAFGAIARAASTRLTEPLFELSGAAAQVANGDYSQRVPVRRRDEVGLLAEAFNAMTCEIGSARSDLETRVQARTAELAAARQEADKANRAKNEFLSLMSHDLRTPLNAILGFAQLLETDNLTPEQRENVAQVLTGGRHLLDLISEVLDITRIESGQMSLSLEPVALREIVEQQIDLVRPIATESLVTFSIGTLDDSRAVMADRQRLRQILLNLFSNAVKYNKRGGSVRIEGRQHGEGRYRISVTDTGAGIPESKMNRLFRPFERLGAEQSAIEGTGLGLAVSKALAEAMGGALWATSIVDTGSTFWLELASADRAEPHVAPEPIAVPRTAARSGLVLYVEDNRSNLRLVERVLDRRPGVKLLHAPTGEAGISLCRSRRPDLVLLDLHLPDIGGEEVLRRLWSDPATRPIPKIVVTADATPGLARRLEDEGATAVMTKPLNLQELLARLDALLGGKGG